MSNISTSFKSISHPIRVQILLMLADRINAGYNFSELSRELQIESSGKLAFHLDKMEDLILQSESGEYQLTTKGKKAVQAIQILGVQSKDDEVLTSQAKITMKEDNDIVADHSETAPSSEGLSIRDFMLLGFLIELFIVYLIPIGFALILNSFSENSDTLGYLTIVFVGLGAFSFGIILPKIADSKGNDEVNSDFGLLLFLLGAWTFLPMILVIGAITYFGIITILLLSGYLFIVPGAWISLKLLSYKTEKKVFPLEFYNLRTKYLVTAIGLSFIPFFNKSIIFTQQPAPNETISITYSITSSIIGLLGFTTMIFVAYVILIFRNFKLTRKIVSEPLKYIILLANTLYLLMINLSNPIFQDVYEDGTIGMQWLIIIILKVLSSSIGGLVGMRIVESHLDEY